MNRFLIFFGIAVVNLAAVPTWACVPPPRDTALAIALAPAAFVARVEAVEQLPTSDCQSEMMAHGMRAGDPGWSACEAYGVARLTVVQVIRGEAEIPAHPVASWTAQAVCYLGWRPQAGDVVLALLPPAGARFHDNANVYVDPFDQNNSEVRRLIAAAAIP